MKAPASLGLLLLLMPALLGEALLLLCMRSTRQRKEMFLKRTYMLGDSASRCTTAARSPSLLVMYGARQRKASTAVACCCALGEKSYKENLGSTMAFFCRSISTDSEIIKEVI